MLNYIKKDITTIIKGIIVHGCNCQGVMGSGVAGALRSKWPEIFEPYEEMCEAYTRNRKVDLLGEINMVWINDDLYVVNGFTQLNYGRNGKIYADVKATWKVLVQCAGQCMGHNLPLYLPPIGCGLGGLSFEKDVKPIIERVAEQYPEVDIYVCDL